MINSSGSLHLFWGHIVRRAHYLLCASERIFGRHFSQQFRQPEIGNFHAPLLVDQNVFRFDVAMDNAFIVSELQRFTNLWDDGQRFFWFDCAVLDDVPKIRPVHVLHDEIIQPVRLTKVKNGHNILVAQFCQSPRLTRKAFGKRRIRSNFRR